MADTHQHDDHHGIAHTASVKTLLGTWGALMALTGFTVFTATQLDFGPSMNLAIAMAIAVVKATLVVLFFMHMIDTPTANRIVFVTSIVFAVVLIIGVFGDLWTRNEIPDHGIFGAGQSEFIDMLG